MKLLQRLGVGGFWVQAKDIDLAGGIDGPEEMTAGIVHQAQRDISARLAVGIVSGDFERNPAVVSWIIGGGAALIAGVGRERAAG